MATSPSYLIDLRSNLFETGRRDEDGEPIVREELFVIAEDRDGRRWAHDHRFVNDGINRVRGAELEAEHFRLKVELAHMNEGWTGPLNNPHWHEIEPCYGSPAYADHADVYAARDNLADGNFDTPEREDELRHIAYGSEVP